MKKLMLCLLLVIPAVVFAENGGPPCGRNEAQSVFSLLIWRAFDDVTELEICEEKGAAFLEAKTSKEGSQIDERVKVLRLSKPAYEKVLALHRDSLSLNLREKEALNLDGSSWCLETKQIYIPSKACFPNPLTNTKKRRLQGLVKLGQELWLLADFRGTNGKLH